MTACGGDDPGAASLSPFGSRPNETVVVGDGKGGVGYVTPVGDGCIQIGAECARPQEKCRANERADVVVDDRGKVVAVVCYPGENAPPTIDSNGNVALGKENKGVVALDGLDDGVDIAGDVTSSGNKVTIYGEGPAVSVIGGNVDADGNNFSMRGVTVKRSVTISGNNASLVLCAIEGDLRIEGNNAVVAECTVFGGIHVKGNNAVIVGNRVGGALTIEGRNESCRGNVSFDDADANLVVAPGELGAPAVCSVR